MKLGKDLEIPLQRWQIDEILEKRVEQQGHKIDDLFLLWSAQAVKPDQGPTFFYDDYVETKYGKLRFFIIPDLPMNKAFVLHRAKFPYPRKENHMGPHGFDHNGDLIN